MKNKWDNVLDFMENDKRISFGDYVSYWIKKTPRRFLHALSYYKFAAKMIGNNKKVLDVGCSEGVGTYLLSKECGESIGVDSDEDAINIANKNFSNKKTFFKNMDFFSFESFEKFDAITSFDVIEHIYKKNENFFYKAILKNLKKDGICIIGTPTEISQKFASKISKKGHVNIYSRENFESILRKYFSYVFMFSANDEVIHTGFANLAHYQIALCCKKKEL